MSSTIYHLSGIRIIDNDNGPDQFSDTARLQIAFSEPTDTFEYEIIRQNDDGFPTIDIVTPVDNIVLNFASVDDPNNLPADADRLDFNLGAVSWSGGTTVMLAVELDKGDTFVDTSFFILSGPVVPITSIESFSAFAQNDITGIGAAGGAFAEGRDIPLADIPGIIVGLDETSYLIEGTEGNDNLSGASGEDTMLGGDGNDTLFGSFGDDSIVGGDDDDVLTGYRNDDTIEGGEGFDTLLINLIGFEDFASEAVVSFGTGELAFYGPDASYGYNFATGAFTNVGDAIEIDRFSGIENVSSLTPLSFVLLGGDGNDSMVGAALADTLIGGAGDDTLQGLGLADVIYAGAGADSIDGGFGSDSIFSGEGNDTILGDFGDDFILANDGDDSIDAGGGADTVGGGIGNDTIDGGDGADRLFGAAGNDSISGGSAGDMLGLGAGDDIGRGEGGNDEIWTTGGDDTAYGGAGDDTLGGFTGNDVLYGDEGADELWGALGFDQLFGGEGNDTLGGADGDDSLSGDEGNDELWGSAGNDQLSGGDGNDRLGGSIGRDRLDGDGGDDQLFGGLDNDTMLGGVGDDTLFGGAGDDLLDGGGSVVIPEQDDDVLWGGPGADTFELRRFGGNDTVMDATAEDYVMFNYALYDPSADPPYKSAQQYIDDHGTAVGDDFVFSFDGGESLTLRGWGDATNAELVDLLTL